VATCRRTRASGLGRGDDRCQPRALLARPSYLASAPTGDIRRGSCLPGCM